MPRMPLRLGSVDFGDDEAPENIGPFGGAQNLAKHVFPGGIISMQLFGPVPEMISWSGTLYGGSALGRADEIDQMRVNSRPVTLQWAGWSYLGIVKFCHISPRNQWEIDYRIDFEPAQDNSQRGGFSTSAMEPTDLLFRALNLAQQQATAPTTGFQFTPAITGGVQQVQQQTQSALQQNQFNLSNVPSATLRQIQSLVTSLSRQLQSLLSGSNSQAASAAADLNNTLNAINLILDRGVPVLAELDTQNPNLMLLAASYYGDPTKWYLIAEANGFLDAVPQGEFHVIIPEDPGRTVERALTLL